MLPERYWSKVKKTDGCWEWQGARHQHGYGLYFMNRERGQQRAHRVSYEDALGPIPKGAYVCHRCDNPACVRPEHLWLGSQAENLADMRAKGRHFSPFKGQLQVGSLNRYAKLTEDDVRAIRLMAPQYTRKDIAAKYGLTVSNVQYVLTRKTWKHVPD